MFSVMKVLLLKELIFVKVFFILILTKSLNFLKILIPQKQI